MSGKPFDAAVAGLVAVKPPGFTGSVGTGSQCGSDAFGGEGGAGVGALGAGATPAMSSQGMLLWTQTPAGPAK